jgi:23S rRNA (guanosine2251-2'-O)-methyltransferase
MQVGSGGHGRKSLEGKGPTPKAEDRTYHPAHQRKLAAERAKSKPRPTRQSSRPRGSSRGDTEAITGRNSVLEALRTKLPLKALHIATGIDHDERTREAMMLANEQGVPLFETTRGELDRLSDGGVHQGIAALAPPYQYSDIDDLLDAAEAKGTAPLFIALDGITDPRNLGAVLRSAGAFGADGVIVPERRAVGVTASAWKVSAGAAARVPVAQVTNLTRALQELKRGGCFVVGLDAGGTTDVGNIHLAADPLVLVIGSEGKGISRLVRETCDLIAAIPISTTTESLNAGVATGIALYEIAKQRQ